MVCNPLSGSRFSSPQSARNLHDYNCAHPTRWWFRLRLELRLVASELVSQQWLVRQFAPECQYSGGGGTLSSPSSGATSSGGEHSR